MFSEMTKKERMMAAINHQPVDRLPTDYWGTPEANAKIMKHLGTTDWDEMFRILKIDGFASAGPAYIGPEPNVVDGIACDIWGVGSKTVAYAGGEGTYYEMFYHPIEKYETVDEIETNYTFPKANWFDFSTIEEQLDRSPDRAAQCGYISMFYMYNNIRGLEQSLMDLCADEEIADYIIGRICDYLYDYHKHLFEAGNGKIDVCQLTDDFGTQTGLMISADMFDRFFKKQYERFMKLLKEYHIKVFHHDDGAMAPLLPRLVDLGIDILNPIQWRLPGMDLEGLKTNFGQKICFHGGIDNQYVLPFGTVEEVRKEVETCIGALASDKTGYIVAPCHNVQMISPAENVVEMYKATQELGKMN